MSARFASALVALIAAGCGYYGPPERDPQPAIESAAHVHDRNCEHEKEEP